MSDYLSCRIGREWYGIPINMVTEVLHMLALRQLPRSEMAGLMTLREKVIPVIDLREYLGIEEFAYELDTPIIALQQEGKRLGIIVDEAEEVVSFPDEAIQLFREALVTGTVRLGTKIYFILDIQALLEKYLDVALDESA